MSSASKLGTLAVALWIASGCGEAEPQVWDSTVVRTVARRADASLVDRELIVLDRSVADGLELPWPAYQSLVTAGFPVVAEAGPDPTIAVLSFIDVVREEDAWIVETTLLLPLSDTTPPIAHRTRWTVRCPGETCEVADSLDLDPPAADTAAAPAVTDTTGAPPDTTGAAP